MSVAPDEMTGSVAPSPSSGPLPDRTVRVLAVSSADEDLRFLRHLFDHSNWIIYTARGCAEAAEFLRRHPMPVVLCDSELADGTWRDLLRTLGASELDSLVIVTSRAADDFLWAEVLNLGGYDVLMKPFDPDEVIRVISLAWLHWKNLRTRMKMREVLLAGEA